MNWEKLDVKAMTLIVVVCTAVVLGVLVIDVQIAKTLAARANELDGNLRLRKWEDEIARSGGTPPRTAVHRHNGSDPVVRNSGVEAGADSQDGEIPMEGWDVFPIDRSQTNGIPGIGNLAVPEKRGTVES